MPIANIIEKITNALQDLPYETQLSLAVVKNGMVDYFGMIKDNKGVHKINNETFAFEIGSVTKAFTGYLLAQMAVEKKIDLDDSVQNFLPFTLLNKPSITLKHLALHTSGLQRMPHDFEVQSNYDKNNPFTNYTENQLATYFAQSLCLDSLPGEKYQYSNLGYGLLSYIISRIEEKPFAEVVDEKIFKPLKMSNSTFDISEVQTKMIKGIDDEGTFCPHWNGGILNGCLGIISTAEDLSRFTTMLSDVSNVAARLQVDETFSVDHLLKSNLGYGERLVLPERICMHGINGGTGGYAASILSNRKQNCSVLILSNIWPWRYMETIYPLGKELLIEVSQNEGR